MDFKLVSNFSPKGDQEQAIDKLTKGVLENKKFQTLLGATGTGKTFTFANVIQKINRPTLVLVHNKTLATQLYGELKEFFPENRVEYFVSNFDYYRPEAYIPQSDTYIEKNAMMNEELEILRAAAINSVLSRRDTIIVASVASIYGLTDPDEYRSLVLFPKVGEIYSREDFVRSLIKIQYRRNNIETNPGQFSQTGDVITIAPPSSSDYLIRIFFDEEDRIEAIKTVKPMTNEVIHTYQELPIFPTYEHTSSENRIKKAIESIKDELIDRLGFFHKNGQLLEEERLSQRTMQDIENLQEFGICPGIENYSRHIDGRKEGEPPFTLFDYFPKDFLLIIDESHVTLPQLHGMYNGDRSRKLNLVEYGFRLPSALDNRPLKFEELEQKINQVIFTSATPGDYEIEKSDNVIVEQIIRPTGLLDPQVTVSFASNPISDLIGEVSKTIEKNERVLILTLTVKDAETLTSYLKKQNFKVHYLHHETKTLERTQVLYQLRKGTYDILIGINLLREGLDIPEVSLICILDADKEGFLRSDKSLIQIIGRAARNVSGRVIMYANSITKSMQKAIDETKRRRDIQEEFNKEHNIIPKTIVKPLIEPIKIMDVKENKAKKGKMTRKEKAQYIKDLEKEMFQEAKNFNFERAAELRDIILELKADS